MTNNNSTYKRLGDYIREVDVRNKDLRYTNLLGLSIAKKFIPSIANMVGTDLRPYKIVKHNQFAYVPVTSRNGEKITVALYTGNEPAIISQAYVVFEIVGTCDTVETVSLQCDQLLPEYLMMWFRRAEFDRYARYHSHGSAREVFDWEEMCNVMLPIPSIEEQRKIVTRYKAIETRIANNKQTIAKLEEAAQALYRKMFVDDVDVENLPDGWRMGCLGEVAEISAGGDKPVCFSETMDNIHNIPIFANGVENDGLYGYTNKAKISIPSVTISARGTIGFVCLRTEPYVPIVRLLVCIPNKLISNSVLYLFYLLKNSKLEGDGAVQLQLTAPKFKDIEIVIPNKKMIEDFENKLSSIVDLNNQIKKENEKLKIILSLMV